MNAFELFLCVTKFADHFAEVRPVANLNMNAAKEKTFPKGLKRDYRGLPIIVSDQGGLETVEPSSSHVGKFKRNANTVGSNYKYAVGCKIFKS